MRPPRALRSGRRDALCVAVLSAATTKNAQDRRYDWAMFVDEARVHVAAGRGGDGAVSFHREKYQPRGGPDGGNGGRGGSVVLVADEGVGSLLWVRDHRHLRARAGGAGRSNNRSGADAEDLVVSVPPGTV